MKPLNIFDKVVELKEKFKHFFFHKKKLQALENLAEVAPFQHKDYLILIKKCMDQGFLGDREADFLCYMSDKYFDENTYLDWTHKTKWLKGEMMRLSQVNKPTKFIQYEIFDREKLMAESQTQVPLAALARKYQPQGARRA